MSGAPYYSDDSVTLYLGDCLDVMRAMPDASVDSIVTDPPYGLGFMGKGWDDLPPGLPWAIECLRVLKPGGHLLAFGGSRTWHRLACAVEDAGFEMRDSIAWLYGSGFPKSLDVSKAIERGERGDLVRAKLLHFAEVRGVDGRWLEEQGVASAASFADWTRGGHVPSDRNWWIVKDALGVTPEQEATFEREVLSQGAARIDDGTVYALGHTGKRLGGAVTDAARTWQGWGTALKPAFEPIVVARKPLIGTVAANVLAFGTGALNVDGCRVPAQARPLIVSKSEPSTGILGNGLNGSSSAGATDAGRWPTNVILDDSQAAELDRQTGVSVSRVGKPRGAANGDGWGMTVTGAEYDDQGGSSRFFPTFRYEAKAPTSERPRVAASGERADSIGYSQLRCKGCGRLQVDGRVPCACPESDWQPDPRHSDYIAHPTVKPLDLMRWLVRLVTPPGGTVLEPFAGSGTTAEACVIEGFQCIAIEREATYLPLIVARLSKPIAVTFDLGSVA